MTRNEFAIKCDEMLIAQLKKELKVKGMTKEDRDIIKADIERLEKLNEERRKNL